MSGVIQPYKGRYVSAASASTKLDLAAIMAGCSAVESEAGNINTISTGLHNAASSLSPGVFSIDGVSVASNVDDCCESIMSVQSSIIGSLGQIRSASIAAYNKIQTQLNSEAQARDQYEINRRKKR